MSKWLEGRVVGQKHWTDRLLSLQVTAPLGPFQAGQFVKLALDVGGERVARPYSFVNPPGANRSSSTATSCRGGPLSPRLAALCRGRRAVRRADIAGFLVLSEVPTAENLWLVATGTGIAPFLSILRTEAPWQRYRRVILVHATRTADELVYGEMIAAIAARARRALPPGRLRQPRERAGRARGPHPGGDPRRPAGARRGAPTLGGALALHAVRQSGRC